MYFFINAFMEVDSIIRPHSELKNCGNLFENRADAVKAVQEMRLILKKYKNED